MSLANLVNKNKTHATDTIIFELLIEDCISEQLIAKTDKEGLKIHIYGNEGTIPHFHVVKNEDTLACIRLDSSNYFKHGKYKGELSKKQLILIDNILRKVDDNGISNYVYAIRMWNKEACKRVGSIVLSESNLQPDYTKTKDYKLN